MGCLPYAIGTIDVDKTLTKMYGDHIDYKIAKTNLSKAIEGSLYGETTKEEVRIKI